MTTPKRRRERFVIIQGGKKDTPDILMLEIFLQSWIAYHQFLAKVLEQTR